MPAQYLFTFDRTQRYRVYWNDHGKPYIKKNGHKVQLQYHGPSMLRSYLIMWELRDQPDAEYLYSEGQLHRPQ
jgi:hypothetical protein